MSHLRYGLDFGTSNSAIALAMNDQVRLLPVDPFAVNPAVARSVLFIEREGGAYIGSEAITVFVERNVGREVVRTRVNTGKIIETFYGDEWVQFDADMGLPGRFFQSLKSFLADDSFEGTDVFGTYYTLEDLIASFLRTLKQRADQSVAQPINAVVLGRPVHFSGDGGAKDDVAQARLAKAARLAGFEQIEFLYEPIGAALQYESTLATEELALVFDFGGGTLDLSVIRLGPQRHGKADRRSDILAVGGVVLGGNTLDEDIMERRLLEYFGSRAVGKTLAGNFVRYPQWLLSQLQSWHTIQLLNERKTVQFLREFKTLAPHHHEEIDALLCLAQKNYGWDLFQAIERAKLALSEQLQTEINFQRDVIRIRESLSRHSFERIIGARLAAIEMGIEQTLADAGVTPEEISIVLRTGGSSLVPAVQVLLEKKFSAAKVFKQEVFTSIVRGLALAGATSA